MKLEGICNFCKKTFSGNAMSKHLQSCTDRKKAIEYDKAEGEAFLIKASCGSYWVYFEANANSTLSNLDSFLRNLWLECCGHLSSFTINGNNYDSSSEPEYGNKSMNISIGKVLSNSSAFNYEYDFGTTTSLSLKVISIRAGKVKEMNTIARNNIPNFRCKCGQPGEEICTECRWKGNGFLCEKCAKKHKCGEEMLLPFVNSPRTGMCGYTGRD